MAAGQVGSNKGFGDPRYRALIDTLITARRERGLSQQGLATRLGQPQQFVSRYELGERRLDVVEFSDVARELGLDDSKLLAAIPERS